MSWKCPRNLFRVQMKVFMRHLWFWFDVMILARIRESYVSADEIRDLRGHPGSNSRRFAGWMRKWSLRLVFAAILPFKNFVPQYEAEKTDGLSKAQEDNNFYGRKAEKDADKTWSGPHTLTDAASVAGEIFVTPEVAQVEIVARKLVFALGCTLCNLAQKSISTPGCTTGPCV